MTEIIAAARTATVTDTAASSDLNVHSLCLVPQTARTQLHSIWDPRVWCDIPDGDSKKGVFVRIQSLVYHNPGRM